MFDNFRARDRDVPHLVATRFSFGRQIRRQPQETPRALPRAVVNNLGQVDRAELNPGVTGVAGLSSPFAARRHRFGARRGARRISRGRTRRVPRVLLGPRREIGNMRFERRELSLHEVEASRPDQNLVFEKREIGLDLGW
jgi:hypothetical protein